MNKNNFFAGFIITYEREYILAETIEKIFNQTLPPEKLWIIDNSSSDLTFQLVNTLNNPKLVYFKVGYNSGPSGAALLGLKLIAENGYKWIYWGDDDDPPIFNDSFEILLKLASSKEDCGCVGSVGQYFDTRRGVIQRVLDSELLGKGSLVVQNIAGNQAKIINSKVINENLVLPNPKLFFGFEELDFDLAIQKVGYRLYVDKGLFLKNRKNAGRYGLKTISKTIPQRELFWRDYYSTRNLLFILKTNKLYFALVRLLMVKFFKVVYYFKFGFKQGLYFASIILSAIYHFIIGKYGLVIKPEKK